MNHGVGCRLDVCCELDDECELCPEATEAACSHRLYSPLPPQLFDLLENTRSPSPSTKYMMYVAAKMVSTVSGTPAS